MQIARREPLARHAELRARHPGKLDRSQGYVGQTGFFDGSRQHRDVKVAVLQFAQLRKRQIDVEFKRDARIILVNRGDQPGQPGDRDEFSDPEPHRARRHFRVADPVPDFRCRHHQSFRILDQFLALGRQPRRTLVAIEQRNPEAAFEILDAHRYAGLGRVQVFGSGGEPAQAANPIKSLQLLERHGISISD